MAGRYDVYAVTFNTTIIGGVGSQSLDTGTEVQTDGSSGNVYSLQASIVRQNPSATFTTRNVAAALGQVGVSGLDMSTVTGGVLLWGYSHLDGGTRAGATSHIKYALAKGIVYPTRLNAAHQTDADVSFTATPIANGATAPVVITPAQTASTAPATDLRYTLGASAKVGNVAITGVKSLEVDFGIRVVTESADGSYWPTYASVVSINPKITIRGTDLLWLGSSTVPLGGLSCTHANTYFYIKKRAAGGTFVADGTAEHIKVSACGVATVTTGMQGSHGGPLETTVVIDCTYDGTNAPVKVDMASAIT